MGGGGGDGSGAPVEGDIVSDGARLGAEVAGGGETGDAGVAGEAEAEGNGVVVFGAFAGLAVGGTAELLSLAATGPLGFSFFAVLVSQPEKSKRRPTASIDKGLLQIIVTPHRKLRLESPAGHCQL